MLAIGNFDGIHLGHCAVIGEAVAIAKRLKAPAAVLSFEPHPRRFFQPAAAPFLLTRLQTKARLIAALGVDLLYLQRFDRILAGCTAEDFVQRYLHGQLAIRHAVVGYHFVFGKGRKGTPELLRDRAAGLGIGVTVVEAVTAPESGSHGDSPPIVYSSTLIREHLAAGEPAAAALLLGRPFEVEGRVRAGDRRGRLLGFPTANLALGNLVRPAFGVYAVRVGLPRGEDWAWVDGVANLGLRPTIGGATPLLEAHLFDISADLYGQRLRVQLLSYLRPERKFSGLDALKAQIAEDAAAARRFLAGLAPTL